MYYILLVVAYYYVGIKGAEIYSLYLSILHLGSFFHLSAALKGLEQNLYFYKPHSSLKTLDG